MANFSPVTAKSRRVLPPKPRACSQATKEKIFQWNKGDKIENRIPCLANFKAKMEYNNSDFNAHKVKQYEAVREAMAWI